MFGWGRSYDWFDRLMGFSERNYRQAKAQMEVVEGNMLRSKETGKAYGCGELDLVSLATLRERVAALGPREQPEGQEPRRLRLSCVQGDVRRMHPSCPGALFQVASQFNLLEMVGPSVTPEDGVSGYAGDPTQGPACAIACGAGTIYRNYFAPVRGQIGQTEDNQLDGIEELGELLAAKMGYKAEQLWRMRNGYCMPSRESLSAIARFLETADEATRDELRAKLSIGVHSNVEITDGREDRAKPLFCSQAYCSALPVSYCGFGRDLWDEFATLVLESLYESTLLAGILNARRPGGTNEVLLTQVGGGAFGNSRSWIEKAMRRAFSKFQHEDLDVKIVCYGGADFWIDDMVEAFGGAPKKNPAPAPAASPTRFMVPLSSSASSDMADDDSSD